MSELQFFYRLDTFQIDAMYQGCKSNSTKYTDPAVYAEVNVTDPPYAVTRDHMVILNTDGKVVDTVPQINPVQPTPTPNPHQNAIDTLKAGFAGTGTSAKLDAIKEALLYLLGA